MQLLYFFLDLLKIFEQLGYKKTDRYPHMVTMSIVFAASIASAMTPISHPLIVLGLNFINKLRGSQSILYRICCTLFLLEFCFSPL